MRRLVGRHSVAVQLAGIAAVATLAACAVPQPMPSFSFTPDDRDVWAVHEDLSENFTLTVYPTTLYRRDSEVMISFRADVDNKSRDRYRDFSSTFVLDPEFDQYLAAGLVSLPTSGVDLFPDGAPELRAGTGGRGIELTFDQIVTDREMLDELGLDPGRVLELAENLTLWLQWRGGEERLEYTAPVQDPDNLLGS